MIRTHACADLTLLQEPHRPGERSSPYDLVDWTCDDRRHLCYCLRHDSILSRPGTLEVDLRTAPTDDREEIETFSLYLPLNSAPHVVQTLP